MCPAVVKDPKGAFRHEYKYLIGTPQYYALRQRLKTAARPDPHTAGDGCYYVTSLYFDNCDDKALREKLDGVNRREKFRLRRYNGDTGFILLEKKQKYDDLCLKTQCAVTLELCRLLACGKPWLPDGADPLMAELDFKMKSQLLRPRAAVTYRREPYIYAPGNVRVTFDSEIRSGPPDSFFSCDMLSVPVESDGKIILELKFDEFLPSLISDIMQVGEIRQSAFSKYAACRSSE